MPHTFINLIQQLHNNATSQTVGKEKIGIRWTDKNTLEDMYIADDLCLMSDKLDQLVETDKLRE